MSELRKKNRDTKLLLAGLCAKIGLVVDAQATSTSGRWKILLGQHSKNGLPCFDVLAVRSDFEKVSTHHFEPSHGDGWTYDTARDAAKKQARDFYEELVAKMTEKPLSEESNEDSGMEILNVDGTTEKYSIN